MRARKRLQPEEAKSPQSAMAASSQGEGESFLWLEEVDGEAADMLVRVPRR
jgi:hypothetical protein